MEIINQKIENIDISDIESIKLIDRTWKLTQIKTENFYKVVKMILDNMKKTSFEPNELQSIYDYIITNYETSIWEETYRKVKELLWIFVKNWGKIEILYKKDLQNNTWEIKNRFNTKPIKFLLIMMFLFSLWLSWSYSFMVLVSNDRNLVFPIITIWLFMVFLSIFLLKKIEDPNLKLKDEITIRKIFISLILMIWIIISNLLIDTIYVNYIDVLSNYQTNILTIIIPIIITILSIYIYLLIWKKFLNLSFKKMIILFFINIIILIWLFGASCWWILFLFKWSF